MKLQFNVTEVDQLPDNYFNHNSWPSKGVYRVTTPEERNKLYFVNSYTVDCLHTAMDNAVVIEDSPVVSEELFLKAIAAAHGNKIS